jgi:hypothetical protein
MTHGHRTPILVTVAASVALVLALLPFATAAHAHRDAPNNACDENTPAAVFDDRDEAAEVHRRNLDCVAALGIAQGRPAADGGRQYDPREAVLRDQMASFVARMLEAAGHDLPAVQDQGFVDTAGNEHEDRINQLAAAGIVQGRTDNRYSPHEPVRRDQMASFVMRAASYAHDARYTPVAGPYFADTANSVHRPNIRAAFEMWVVSGRSTQEYAPHDEVRRDEMASFLARLIDLIHPDQWRNSNQSFIVAPQEAVTRPAGDPQEMSVGARYDGRPFTGPVDIALLPCGNADPTASPVTFADRDANGLADGFASTAQDQAYISQVNGQPTGGRALHVRDATPASDGVLRFTVVAGPGADCAVVAVFVSRAIDDGLRLDAGRRPATAFGVGEVTWR